MNQFEPIRFSQLAIVLTCLVKSLDEADVSQQTHFLEVFAGHHILHSAMELEGLKSRAFDVNYSRKMNLLSTFGFLLACNYVRHIIQGGVAWFALPCCSWVFMSRGTTRRHYLRPQGWEEVVSTAVGNRLARRLAYLLELCHIKGIYYIIEQPSSSLLFRYKPIKQLLERHGASFVRCALGAYNASTLKPVTLYGTAPFLDNLALQPSKLKRQQLKRVKSFLKLETARVYTDSKGS